MSKEKGNEYIRVCSDATIFISPPPMKGFYKKENCKFENVILNEAACQLFALAQKESSVKEVITQYLQALNKNNAENYNQIYQFLDSLRKIGIFEFVASPADNSKRIIGDISRYFPKIATIELTEKCNLKCSHCYNESHSKKSSFINWQELRRKLVQLKERGLFNIQFTGGEVFLHPDFEDILEFSCENFSGIVILTNGTLITDNFIDRFKAFKEKIKFSISLDSHAPEIHDKIRNFKGCFEMTSEGIKKLRNAGFYVKIAMTFDENNIENISRTFDYSVDELNASTFSHSPIIPYGRGHGHSCILDFNHGLLKKIESEVKKMKASPHRERLFRPAGMNKAIPKNCGAGYKNFTICSDGTLKPCVLFPKHFCRIGNILTDDLDEIFSYDNLKFFVNADTSIGKACCDECGFNRQFCEGCLLNSMVAAAKTGNCQWQKINSEEIKNLWEPQYAHDIDITKFLKK